MGWLRFTASASLDNTDQNSENLTEEGSDKEISGSDVDVPGPEENDVGEKNWLRRWGK